MTAPSPRTSALISGFAYLAMTVIAFATALDPAVFSELVEGAGEPAPWPPTVQAGIFNLAAGLAVIAVLDVVIALGTWLLFRTGAPRISFWMGAARIAYAVLFGFAIAHLWTVYGIIRSTEMDASSVNAVLDAHQRFRAGWDLAFFVFALHLVLLGWLVWSDGIVRKVLGILLVVAGVGYFADSVIAFAMPRIEFRFGLYTFIGEMTFMIWLLVAAGRRRTGERP